MVGKWYDIFNEFKIIVFVLIIDNILLGKGIFLSNNLYDFWNI